jgi:hypothetical protein
MKAAYQNSSVIGLKGKPSRNVTRILKNHGQAQEPALRTYYGANAGVAKVHGTFRAGKFLALMRAKP